MVTFGRNMINNNVFPEFYKEFINDYSTLSLLRFTLEFKTSRNYKVPCI